MHYAFLGHQPELSLQELEALSGDQPELAAPGIARLPRDPLVFASRLGGVLKLARELVVVNQLAVLPELSRLIRESGIKNIAISNYTTDPLPASDLRELKTQVTAERPLRFVSFEDRGHELVMLAKKHVQEYNLIPSGTDTVIAETVWISDSLGFAARDRRKPYQDIKRGMLPVKIARMMVNLASRGQDQLTLYDPFCGTGTILLEALLTGCHVLGSDLDSAAVQGTVANLAWLQDRYQLDRSYEIVASEVSHPPFSKVDCIVTEPLMGPLLTSSRLPDPEKAKGIARGLDKLYRGAFRAWLPLLPKQGRVVITLPEFSLNGRIIPTISIDTIKSLGYNYVLSVPYSKPGATVMRNITVLEKS